MFWYTVQILAGLVLLYLGAEALVRGSSALALRLRVSPMIIGLTIVAMGTSSPELIVNLKAAVIGSSDISLGNVIGSNISNIGLILGLSVIIRPVRVHLNTIRNDVPFLILSSILCVFFLLNRYLSRAEGLILFAGIVLFLGFQIFQARKELKAYSAISSESHKILSGRHVLIDVLLVIGGIGLLVAGADFLVRGSIGVAAALGVSQAFIGLSVVALGTSLPELATSVVASIKKQSDIAVGNVIGSNIFNIHFVLGTTGLFRPLHGEQINPFELWFMLGMSVLLLPFLLTRFTLNRSEGVVLLLLYGVFIYCILPV